MVIEIIFIIALITALAFILLIVTGFSYRTYKNKKLLFVSIVFLVLFIRGILLSIGIFYDQVAAITQTGYIWIFDLAILVLLYLAYSMKR